MHLPASVVTTGVTVTAVWISHWTVINIVPNWIADSFELLFKKVFIRHNRNHYIYYTHAKRHQLPTNEHVGKLKTCEDHPCDLLHKPHDDLGLW